MKSISVFQLFNDILTTAYVICIVSNGKILDDYEQLSATDEKGKMQWTTLGFHAGIDLTEPKGSHEILNQVRLKLQTGTSRRRNNTRAVEYT